MNTLVRPTPSVKRLMSKWSGWTYHAWENLSEVLAAANETMAAQLKAETDKLLDSVLYTTSMNMKNGFHMSDF